MNFVISIFLVFRKVYDKTLKFIHTIRLRGKTSQLWMKSFYNTFINQVYDNESSKNFS